MNIHRDWRDKYFTYCDIPLLVVFGAMVVVEAVLAVELSSPPHLFDILQNKRLEKE